MATWLVSRHAATNEWIKEKLVVDRVVDHLETELVDAGDLVIGVLPINLVSDICERGARYQHLVLNLPREARGRELSRHELDRYGAQLQEFRAMRVAME